MATGNGLKLISGTWAFVLATLLFACHLTARGADGSADSVQPFNLADYFAQPKSCSGCCSSHKFVRHGWPGALRRRHDESDMSVLELRHFNNARRSRGANGVTGGG